MTITILIAIMLAGLRIAGITHETFQAIAHLFVGYLIGTWWIGRYMQAHQAKTKARINLYTAIALTIVEVGAFLWFRFFA